MSYLSWRHAGMLVSLGLCSACGDPEGDPPDDREPAGTWEPAFDTSESAALFGVWGSGPDDVFIVGGTDESAEIYHFDGNAWSPMAAPAVPALIWVSGFGPDDVYAVGLEGAVVHYDGDAWTELDSGVEAPLWGIFGFDPSEVWIVGGDATFDDEPTVLDYDGDTFDQVQIAPEENSRGAHALFKVWGIGDKLFALGHRGQILERSGDTWVNSPAGGAADQDFVSLWGTSETNIVAVGGRSNARIAHFDGESWTTRGETGLGGINAVFMSDPDVAILGGVEGFVGRYHVDRDEIVAEEQSVTDIDIHAIWGDGNGTQYAVAGEFLPPFRGAALERKSP